MAFYYFSIDFFWLLFTSVLAPFALALLIVSLLVSADQSDGSRETGFGQEKRVEFVRKVETFADSGEKLAECKAPVDGSSRFLQMAEEVAEDEPIEENPVVGEAGAGGFLGTATDSARDETGLIENGEVSVPDDDWEGVERTELERVFAAAVSFVGSKRNADRISKLGRDLAAEMFGLHKITTVGPCCEPQPMVFKASARAKWNAWRRLGNMNQDTAMEQYIELLSGSIPWWLQDDGDGDNKWDHTAMFTVSANQPIAADWSSLNELKENFYLTKSSSQILETPTKVERKHGSNSCFYLYEKLNDDMVDTVPMQKNYVQDDSCEQSQALPNSLEEHYGGSVNLYIDKDKNTCLHFQRTIDGSNHQCPNPEPFFNFLGLLESIPLHDTTSSNGSDNNGTLDMSMQGTCLQF